MIYFEKLKLKRFLKQHNFGFFPNTYLLCKNKKYNILYLAVVTLTHNIEFLKESKLENEDDQIKEIFSEFDFNENSAGGFDMFPGFQNKIYGYCDNKNLILGSSCQIIRY